MEEYVAIVVNNKGVSIDPKLQQTDIKRTKGACKYYISTLWGVGGQTRNAYFAYVVRGGWGGQRQNAYVKDLNP